MTIITIMSMPTMALAMSIEFNDGPLNTGYNRITARDYLNSYTWTPNTYYYYYSADCTNFISQMLRSGGMSMTTQKTNPTSADWYYYGPNIPYRTSSWTGAHQSRQYWGVINGSGHKKARAMVKFTNAELKNNTLNAYGVLVNLCELGDVIQFVDSTGNTTHSMGVQRVYVENGTKKVTISQHTPDDFYHLTTKISGRPQNGWVCLLKVKPAATSGNSQTLGIVEQCLGKEKTESLLTREDRSTMVKTASENINVEDLSTESLSECFHTLQDSSYPTLEESDAALSTAAIIGRILDARFDTLNTEEQLHRMSEPITKETLIGFVTMQMEDIRAEYLPYGVENKPITMSVEDEEMLKTLSAFISDVEENASDKNVYGYWCRYWEDIRNESLPIYYYRVE